VCVFVCPAMRFHTVARIRLKLCGNSLRVTESCMGYFILSARLRACARRVRAHHACARMHIIEHIRSKVGGDIPLHGLHDFYMRTCVCTLCVHYARTISMPVLHACARSHIFGRILSKFSATFYVSQRDAWTA
jgi:hypothetical protein